MKIIHAHKYYYLRAGAERYLFDVMKLAQQAGHTVAPFSMHNVHNEASPWSEYFVSELETDRAGRGAQALRQLGRSFWSWEAGKKMRALIDAFEPDVVHAHNVYTHLSPSVLHAAKHAGVPVVMTVHDYALASANYALWDGKQPMDLDHLGVWPTARTRFMKKSFAATWTLAMVQSWQRRLQMYERTVSRFLATSEFVADVLVRAGYEEKKIEVLYPVTQAVPEKVSVHDDGYVLYVGRLESYKGVATLIEAMDAFPEVTLKIAGTGSQQDALQELAKGMENVTFLGFVKGEELMQLQAKARVAVVPSIWYEPFGLVAVEAMRTGTPVIVSDRGGLPEIVEGGVSGAVFEAGNVHALRDALKPFLFEQGYAKAMSEAALARVRVLGGAEDHWHQLSGVYQSVIEEKEAELEKKEAEME